MDIQEVLARNMRFYRKERGLTQEKLAEICGLHRTYIGGIEQERINVSLNNISKIANALGVSASDLLMEDAQANADRGTADLAGYALANLEGGDLKIQMGDMKDPGLDMQILVSLIQSGVTDIDELAAQYKQVEHTLLEYFKANSL